MKLLLDKGADPNAKTVSGKSALDVAKVSDLLRPPAAMTRLGAAKGLGGADNNPRAQVLIDHGAK